MLDDEKFGPDVPIGRRIKALAVLRKMSATELAKQLGVVEQRVYDIYNSRTMPNKQEVHALAEIFKASRRWLTTGVGDPLRPSPFRKPPRAMPHPKDPGGVPDEDFMDRIRRRIHEAAKGGGT